MVTGNGSSNGVKEKSYNVGKAWGYEAANYAKENYPEVINNAEVFSDLDGIMKDFWSDFLKEYYLMFDALSVEDVKAGWTDGFYDIIFPLRDMV